MPPELLDRLRLLAAHTVLGRVIVDEIVGFAHELLDMRHYDDELLAIIDSRPLSLSEVVPRFQRYCSKVGIKILSADDALTAFLFHRVSRMLTMPSLALDELEKLVSETQFAGLKRLRELHPNCEAAINDLCFIETLHDWYTQSHQETLQPGESTSSSFSDLQRQAIRAATQICASISLP